MKYYIIAGEASGDLHGSNLMKSLKQLDAEATFRVWGGDKMRHECASPAQLIKHYRNLDFVGFTEVVGNLRTILRNIEFCKQDILEDQPDVLVLIDYPGFNLRIAKWAKKQQIKVIYYISPQVWAWNAARVRTIKKVVDKMLVILPFEQDFYKQHDYNVDFVGHPLLDSIDAYPTNEDFRAKNNLPLERKIIALLPGSRGQEIKNLLQVMLQLVPHFEKYQFVVAGAPSIDAAVYQKHIDKFFQQHHKNEHFRTKSDVKIVFGQTYDLLNNAHAAVVASGTATLETALFQVPQVVCYKGSQISYEIAKRIVKIKYISLVNLIMDKEVIRELIQNDFNIGNLNHQLIHILEPNNRQQIAKDYQLLREKLGGGGASERSAQIIFDFANGKTASSAVV